MNTNRNTNMNNMNKNPKKNLKNYLFSLVLFLLALAYGYAFKDKVVQKPVQQIDVSENSDKLDVNNLPKFTGKPYITINGNVPNFSKEDLTTKSYENYSNLDKLGRCGVANAVIGVDLMPKDKRESIYDIKPTAWKAIRDDKIDGGSLYNRSHLIAFQLAGENANEKNLITGTRFLNATGMIPFEHLVYDYVVETKNHVRLRVTPIFVGDELLARGVQMEGMSVEDNGKAVSFNVYIFNVQPGYELNYKTGHAKKLK